MRTRLVVLLSTFVSICIGSGATAAGVESLPEPGPENGGLRLRLVVQTVHNGSGDAHHVRLDLVNVTEQAISLTAHGLHEYDKGDFKDCLEAATNIESYPRIHQENWQTVTNLRTPPEPQYVLNPKDTLSVQWESLGNTLKLKNKSVDPNVTLNPEFPANGLYSVHATLRVRTSDGDYLLRSNEQQVSIGGSRKMPKHSCGMMSWSDAAERIAEINLGSLQGVKAGDRFITRTGVSEYWCLTVATVKPDRTIGKAIATDYWGHKTTQLRETPQRFTSETRLVTRTPPDAAASPSTVGSLH